MIEDADDMAANVASEVKVSLDFTSGVMVDGVTGTRANEASKSIFVSAEVPEPIIYDLVEAAIERFK